MGVSVAQLADTLVLRSVLDTHILGDILFICGAAMDFELLAVVDLGNRQEF